MKRINKKMVASLAAFGCISTSLMAQGFDPAAEMSSGSGIPFRLSQITSSGRYTNSAKYGSGTLKIKMVDHNTFEGVVRGQLSVNL